MPHPIRTLAGTVATLLQRWLAATTVERPQHLAAPAVDVTLQRVTGSRDFLPCSWLLEGAKAADAVAQLRKGRGAVGTGFLVSPWLLLTNHHVLPQPQDASTTVAVFRYAADDDNRITQACELRLAPTRCFVTSPVDDLDYTLVALAPLADGRAPGAVFGSLPLQAATTVPQTGEPVNIIQHPAGRPQEIAVRNNKVVDDDHPEYLSYETDSEPGSSGSPVLNDEWELVALHSRSELRSRAGHGSSAQADWVANKGIRIAAIVTDLVNRTGSLGSEAAALINEALAGRRA
jgi:endonuclease G